MTEISKISQEQKEAFKKKAEQIRDLKMLKAEEEFKQMMKQLEIKHGSKTYIKYQSMYFHGAMCILGEQPAKWGVHLLSNRPINKD